MEVIGGYRDKKLGDGWTGWGEWWGGGVMGAMRGEDLKWS